MAERNVQALLDLKSDLKEQLEEARATVERLESYLDAIDSIIGKGSFTTAASAFAAKEPPSGTLEQMESTAKTEAEDEEFRTIEVMDKAGEKDLATIELQGNTLDILPAEHALYDIKKGAFARFFVERILGQFQQSDRKRVEEGEIDWEQAFDFEVHADDGILEEIIIRNYGDKSRLAEIQNTLRWALEKIYRPR
ncbi:MAG: hypothetical protein R6V83_03135 [Candidatus Thorarchaeota archaeon]